MNMPAPSVNEHLPEGVSYQEYWEAKYAEMTYEIATEVDERVSEKVERTNGATYLEFTDREVARDWLKKHGYDIWLIG